MCTKTISNQKNWDVVVDELASENLKLALYDHTLIPLLGDLSGKKILDYGSGPGVLALALQKLDADVSVYDINQEMLQRSGEKIGLDKVYGHIEDIPNDSFDFIICNLVLCIVPDDEVKTILKNIKTLMHPEGFAYIGFCNPKIFDVHESNLDFRFPTGNTYENNHNYKKVKKEGNYEIIETHRPIEWYEKIFTEGGLTLIEKIVTPSYTIQNTTIDGDFIIFKLKLITNNLLA